MSKASGPQKADAALQPRLRQGQCHQHAQPHAHPALRTCYAPLRQVHCRPPGRRRRLELLPIKVEVGVQPHALQQLAPPRLDRALAVAARGGEVEGDRLQLAAR